MTVTGDDGSAAQRPDDFESGDLEDAGHDGDPADVDVEDFGTGEDGGPAAGDGMPEGELDGDTGEGADLVAELDDDPDPAFEDGQRYGDDEEPPPVYTGTCHDGPWDGRRVTVRFPKGFLLVDRPNVQVWIYDRHEDSGDFYARSPDPRALLEDGPQNRWRAAEEPNYDLLVVDAALDDDQGDDEDDERVDDGTLGEAVV